MAKRSPARLAKASDVIVEGIRERIMQERLEVGSPLPSESDLMDEYGLGRVTVRESLRLLERDGIVRVKRGPHGGVFVGEPDVQRLGEVLTVLLAMRDTTVREFTEFRGSLEPQLAALTAKNATAEQRDVLRRIADDEDFATQYDLHEALADFCGNSVYTMAFYALEGAFLVHHRHRPLNPHAQAMKVAAHRKVARLAAAGDAEAARRAMSRHLDAYDEEMNLVGALDEPFIRYNGRSEPR